MRQRSVVRSLAVAVGLTLAACASPPAQKRETGAGDEVVGYRLLTKADFQAPSSGQLWGNIYHGAEICTQIIPTEDHDQTGAYRAVMRPGCSFWNETGGKIGTLGGIADASVIPFLGTPQPEWYTLQHEQIHFAIMEVAARRLSQRIAEMPEASRTASQIDTAYRLTLTATRDRHAEFDAATSGTFDPHKLNVWVGALETEMRRFCGREPRCWVRHRNPLGWGKP